MNVGNTVAVPVLSSWKTAIQATDAAGNAIDNRGGNLVVQASLEGNPSVTVPVTTLDKGSGRYEVQTAFPKPGQYHLQAMLDGKIVTSPTMLNVDVVAGPPGGSYIFDGVNRFVENQSPYVRTYVEKPWATWVQAVDDYNNTIRVGGGSLQAIAVKRGGGGLPIQLGVIDNMNGTYLVTKRGGFDSAGTYDVSLSLDGENSWNTPMPVTVGPSPPTSGRYVLPQVCGFV